MLLNDDDGFDRLVYDRLVDDELSPDDCRRLLASLDDEPGGWRRCAMAFLEAQAWRRELGELRHEADVRPQPAKANPSRRWVPTWQGALAIAGSVVLAFCLGVGSAEFLAPRPQEPLAGGNSPPQPESIVEAAPQPAGNVPRRQHGLRPAGSVRLVVNDEGAEPTDAGELAVYEVNQNVAQYLAEREPAIPLEFIEMLEHRGHTVERHEQYLPIDLEDGRQMIVPVEGYRISPAAVAF
jgi:hypothetical protein